MVREQQILEFIEDKLCGRVVITLDLIANYLFLHFQLSLRIGAVEDNVGQEADGPFHMVAQHGSIINGMLLGGKGIQLAAHAFQFIEYLQGAALLRSLERGVLYEVGQSFLARQLMARTGSYGIAAIHHLLTRCGQVNNTKAVRQRFTIILHQPAKVRKS